MRIIYTFIAYPYNTIFIRKYKDSNYFFVNLLTIFGLNTLIVMLLCVVKIEKGHFHVFGDNALAHRKLQMVKMASIRLNQS